MIRLNLASCMAENSESFCHAVAHYIDDQLGVPTDYVTGIPWQERERLFDEGHIQILWLCGLPYVQKADLSANALELLAVPVPTGPRYRARPVYFSDVVVRRNSPYQTLFDLRGASWAYNEPRSHSGYNVVRAYLAEFGERHGFFGEALETGAHSASLNMVMRGKVDGAAIDSTVLEWILSERESIAERIRVIETIGPSPIPPWVISKQASEALRIDLRSLLLRMHQDPIGRRILGRARMERFTEALNSDYDPIRRMAKAAEQVALRIT
ncbi:MAG TPA: PhnD/SsuA/transferrin family substrate-binding protein [Candidatus Binatia bacterium]|nr:PhnD/SsuA/transferrin family substrate-binding protein [Candidatus Binatia bacterium]